LTAEYKKRRSFSQAPQKIPNALEDDNGFILYFRISQKSKMNHSIIKNAVN
jgi:hypothetical protein